MNHPWIIVTPGVILLTVAVPVTMTLHLGGWLDRGTLDPRSVRKPAWVVFLATLAWVVLDSLFR
jgi:hypothetical protein